VEDQGDHGAVTQIRPSAGSWLRESHNFSDQMNFYLESDQAEQLATYLLTLREAE